MSIIVGRPHESAFERDNNSLFWPSLQLLLLSLFAQALDTEQMTQELRREGWLVTHAGVANALAQARDDAHAARIAA